MLDMISNFLTTVDDFVWGIPLIVLILATGLFLTARLHFLQITKLPHAIKHLIANEKSGEERKQLDIKYAKEFSFWLDMKILCKTLTAFVQKENV